MKCANESLYIRGRTVADVSTSSVPYIVVRIADSVVVIDLQEMSNE